MYFALFLCLIEVLELITFFLVTLGNQPIGVFDFVPVVQRVLTEFLNGQTLLLLMKVNLTDEHAPRNIFSHYLLPHLPLEIKRPTHTVVQNFCSYTRIRI